MPADANDLATAIATEVAKQVPVKEVYQDGLAPAVRETGSALADFVKTLRLALAPLQFTAALQDRYVKFLDQAVRKVPDDRRVLPPPQIAGPIIEAIKFEPEDTVITEMFNELLSKAFDRDTIERTHPAFAPIVRQLSIDEAVMLTDIYKKHLAGEHFHYQETQDLNHETNRFGAANVELDELPRDKLRSPDRVGVYLEHLDKLGVAILSQYKNQEAIFASRVQVGTRVYARYQLTEFGVALLEAASPPAA